MAADDKLLNDELMQWVTFGLNNEKYGISVLQIQEVLRLVEINDIPGSPHYVLGLINLRGQMVTVVDLRRKLGLVEQELTDATRILITELKGVTIGFLVDEVFEVIYVRSGQIESQQDISEQAHHYIQGVWHDESTKDLFIFLDINQLFQTDEWQQMNIEC